MSIIYQQDKIETISVSSPQTYAVNTGRTDIQVGIFSRAITERSWMQDYIQRASFNGDGSETAFTAPSHFRVLNTDAFTVFVGPNEMTSGVTKSVNNNVPTATFQSAPATGTDNVQIRILKAQMIEDTESENWETFFPLLPEHQNKFFKFDLDAPLTGQHGQWHKVAIVQVVEATARRILNAIGGSSGDINFIVGSGVGI